ncbi:hypothetical protein BZA70DRAFT_311990 [Myxozyma melibiosi]|uniref:Nucleosome assembly protein n=1 Tax=Myxozyma melibiosi TaxID=54550 RepID=A0ABR1F1T5_9ASCO
MAEETDSQTVFKELSKLEHEFEQAEFEILKYSTKLLKPLYEKRKALLPKVEKFWSVAFEQIGEDLDQYLTPLDAELLESLDTIDLDRDETDPRTFTLTFSFKDNKFLETTTLSKTFTYVPKPSSPEDDDDEDSEDITESARVSYKSTKAPIKWKQGQDLTKTKPGQPISFFTFFEWENKGEEEDAKGGDVFANAHEVAILIAEELYPNAVKLYTDALIEEEEDDEEEIDLEEMLTIEITDEEDDDEDEEDEPPRKKSKK